MVTRLNVAYIFSLHTEFSRQTRKISISTNYQTVSGMYEIKINTALQLSMQMHFFFVHVLKIGVHDHFIFTKMINIFFFLFILPFFLSFFQSYSQSIWNFLLFENYVEATNLLLISTCTMYDDYTCKYYTSFLRIKCNFEFYQREFMVYGKQGNFEVFERIITLKLLITTFIILEFMRKNLQLISRICMSKILNK